MYCYSEVVDEKIPESFINFSKIIYLDFLSPRTVLRAGDAAMHKTLGLTLIPMRGRQACR